MFSNLFQISKSTVLFGIQYIYLIYLGSKNNALLSTSNSLQKFIAMVRKLAKTVATSMAKILAWQTQRERQWHHVAPSMAKGSRRQTCQQELVASCMAISLSVASYPSRKSKTNIFLNSGAQGMGPSLP